jgi:hypothetical protein
MNEPRGRSIAAQKYEAGKATTMVDAVSPSVVIVWENSTVNRILLLAFLALGAVQDTPVTHARIRLDYKPEPAVKLTIVNRRASPLTRIEIGLFVGTATKPTIVHDSYAPLDAHAERTTDIRIEQTVIDHASIMLAVFADGYYEGTPDAVAAWKAERQAQADDLVYWIGVLETMPRVSEPDLRKFLSAHVAAHSDTPQPGRETVRTRLTRILGRYPAGLEVWPPLDALKIDAQAELSALQRPLPTFASDRGDPPAAPAVDMIARLKATTTTLMAIVDNEGDAAIEAVGFEVEAGAARASSAQSHDFCPSKPGDGAPNARQIQPRQSREFTVAVAPPAEAVLPPVRLTFVLFADGSSEGRVAERERLLRSRQCGP